MSEEKMICITCPRGCTLEISRTGDTVLSVREHGCKRGPLYAEAEIRDPRRMVASTVRIQGSLHPLLPVYTSAPFPKERIRDLLNELRSVVVSAPVSTGQVVLKDALGTGIDILASRTMA